MPVDVAELSLLELQPFQVRAALLKAGLFRKAKSNTCLCKTVMMAMMMMMVMMTVTTTTIFRFFFFNYLFIYLFLAALGLHCSGGGYSSLQCTGFSLQWLLLLWRMGSRLMGFSSCGTQAQ